MKTTRLICCILIAATLMLVAPSALAETKYASEPVYMREGPSVKHMEVVELQPGDSVETLGVSDNWTLVEFDGETGYVFSKYLTDQQLLRAAAAKANVNIRAGAGTKYEVVGKLSKGINVLVLFISGSWARITYDNIDGFVNLRYLTIGDTFAASNLANVLTKSGYFDNSYDLIGVYIDNNDRLVIKISKSANLSKIKRDIAKIFSGEKGKYTIVKATLPDYVNETYIDYLTSQIVTKFSKLTASQQKQLQWAAIGFDAETERMIVEIVKLDDNKKALFKEWISDWEYITLISVDSIPLPKT